LDPLLRERNNRDQKLWGGLASGEATRLMVSSMANHPDDTNAQTVSGQATESEATITHTRVGELILETWYNGR
ncbi:hypothetical protein FRB94_003380, partial [Tulasnella sp. JGI-2019a]